MTWQPIETSSEPQDTFSSPEYRIPSGFEIVRRAAGDDALRVLWAELPEPPT